MAPKPPFSENSPQVPPDTLGLTADEMRRLGYKMVDMVVDRFEHRDSEPVVTIGDANDLNQQLGGALPESPMDPDASLELMANVALAHMQHGDHPRYFARVPGPASFAAILGDWMGTGFNSICASWGGGSGPAVVESTVVSWLAEMLGLPDQTEGVLLSGGSMANFTAFCVARSEVGRGVAYLMDQTHASLPRNLKHMGLSDDEIRVLPSDDRLRMCPKALEQAIESDIRKGLKPMLVVGTAGTTNTGVSDPLRQISDICKRHDIWMHVDGAYGAPAAMTKAGRRALQGLERADSVVLDPHKWLFQPYDLGMCFVTRPGALDRCFSMNPEYLKDVQTDDQVSYGNRSLELTRRSRALKLWLSLRTYGASAFRQAVQRGIDLAEEAERQLRAEPETWEILSPAQLGVVCFGLKGATADDHSRRADRISQSGFATLSTTTLKGKSALRLCTINPLTTQDDIRLTLRHLSEEE